MLDKHPLSSSPPDPPPSYDNQTHDGANCVVEAGSSGAVTYVEQQFCTRSPHAEIPIDSNQARRIMLSRNKPNLPWWFRHASEMHDFIRAVGSCPPRPVLQIIGQITTKSEVATTLFNLKIGLAPVELPDVVDFERYRYVPKVGRTSAMMQTMNKVREIHAAWRCAGNAPWTSCPEIDEGFPELSFGPPPPPDRDQSLEVDSALLDPLGEAEQALLGSSNSDRSAPGLYDMCTRAVKSRSWLKVLTVTREVWGWDLAALEDTLQPKIQAVFPEERINVKVRLQYRVGSSEYLVNSDTISVYTAGWVWILVPLLIVVATLAMGIYLAIAVGGFLGVVIMVSTVGWSFLLGFSSHDVILPKVAAQFANARVFFPLKFYLPLPDTLPDEDLAVARTRYQATATAHNLPPNAHLVSSPRGVHYLAGRREGEWLREWEAKIVTAAGSKRDCWLSPRSPSTGRVPDGYQEHNDSTVSTIE